MIKKLLKYLFLFLLVLIPCFSKAEQIFNLNGEYLIADSLNANYFSLEGNANFLLNDQYRVLSVYGGYTPFEYPRLWNVFWGRYGLYYIVSCEGGFECGDIHTSIESQGYFTHYCASAYQETCYESNLAVSSFYEGGLRNPSAMRLVQAGENLVFCFDYDLTIGSRCFNHYVKDTTNYNSIGLTYNPTASQIGSSVLGSNVTVSVWGSPGTVPVTTAPKGVAVGSDESAVNFYEKRYGWDIRMCYVGVNNTTDLWGASGVSFDEGHGLTIFDTFYQLYGSRDPNKVYVWINSRLRNYYQWYGTDGNPSYLLHYNFSGNRSDIYYDNLTYPWRNQPVAIYFMTDYLNYRTEGYSTMGSEIVSYCNIKLGSGTYDDIIDDSSKENIDNYTEQTNVNVGLNPDGSSRGYDNINLIIGYTGDSYVSSGIEIAFEGDTTVKNTLKQFFNEFDGAFSGASLSHSYTLLPNFIIIAFLFVVLFKVLRRR